MITPSAILERFMNSDAAKQMAADYAAEELAKRRELAAELAALDAAHAENIAVLRGREADLAERVKAHREVLAGVERRARDAAVAVTVASQQHDAARRRIERELRATASPEIDDAVRDLDRAAEATRQQGFTTWRSKPTLDGRRYIINNEASVIARLEAIKAARPAVEALRLLPLMPAELTARLDAIRNGIPAVQPPDVPRHLRHLFDEPETAEEE